MDVTNTLNPSQSTFSAKNDVVSNPKAVLRKDDFMKLLLTELQYQDPTNPMDSEKMLSQTSQLATLEASENTNKALEALSKTLTQSASLSVISAIGNIATLKNSDILLKEDETANFDIYLPQDAKSPILSIEDTDGNVLRQISLQDLGKGVHTFQWDGKDDAQQVVDPGTYHAKINYTTENGEAKSAQVGTYPIESIRFDQGNALFKLGSHYIPMNQIQEISKG